MAPKISFYYLCGMEDELAGISIKFNEQALGALNFALAFIMLGIALDLKRDDFSKLLQQPRAAFIGLASQYLALPTITFLLVWLLQPAPSLALGMILVAACPGGNVSNFFSYLAKGNVSLSVSLSMVSTLAAVVLTPLQLQFWGSLLPETSAILTSVNLNLLDTLRVVATIMVMPILLGMFVSWKYPKLSAALKKPIKVLSFLILLGIIAGGLASNWKLFLDYYDRVIFLVFAHNGLALLAGFALGIVSGIGRAATKTVTIETAIQNSGLGLVLIFNFFEGNGGMAIITAWWGIWHILSGFTVSQLFKRYYPS